MGILDGNSFDRQASEAATPGWLGRALASPGVGVGLAPVSAGLPPAAVPAAPQAAAGNPFAALLGGLGAAVSPRGVPAASGPGLGERANAAVVNFLNGHGVLPAIGGAITGATTGQRTDAAGVVQAQQAATARALVGAGVAPDVAQAAALNPDIMQLIAPLLAAALQRPGAAAQGGPAPAPAAEPTQAAAPDPQQFRSTGKTQQG